MTETKEDQKNAAKAPAKKKPAAKKKAAPARPAPAKKKSARPARGQSWSYIFGSSPKFDETVDSWTLSDKQYASRKEAMIAAAANQDVYLARPVRIFDAYRVQTTTKLSPVRK